MTIVISSVILLFIFLGILVVEKRYHQRTDSLIKRSDEMIDDLANTVQEKYREKYGKDPTVKIPLMDKKSDS